MTFCATSISVLYQGIERGGGIFAHYTIGKSGTIYCCIMRRVMKMRGVLQPFGRKNFLPISFKNTFYMDKIIREID